MNKICVSFFCLISVYLGVFTTVNADDNMTLQDIAMISQSNTEIIRANFSYSYQLDTHYIESGRRITARNLFRRKGDKFFHMVQTSDYGSASLETPQLLNSIQLFAFDGNNMRINNMRTEFAKDYLPAPKHLFNDVLVYESMLASDRKEQDIRIQSRPPGKASGSLGEGLNGRPEGHWVEDRYMVGGLYFPVFVPPITWDKLLSKSHARIVERSGDLVTVNVRLSPSLEQLRVDYPDYPEEKIQQVYNRWVCDFVVDVSKGCMVVESVLQDNYNDNVYSKLENVKLEQDLLTGAWYSTQYDHDSVADQVKSSMRLLAASSEEISDEVFSQVWFDEQIVTSHITNESYYFLLRNPSEYNEDQYMKLTNLSAEDRAEALKTILHEDLDALIEVEIPELKLDGAFDEKVIGRLILIEPESKIGLSTLLKIAAMLLLTILAICVVKAGYKRYAKVKS